MGVPCPIGEDDRFLLANKPRYEKEKRKLVMYEAHEMLIEETGGYRFGNSRIAVCLPGGRGNKAETEISRKSYFFRHVSPWTSV